MSNLLDSAIEEVRRPDPWVFGNQVLYDLCTANPGHTDPNVVVAKVWLIGRSYSAAIERRRIVDRPGDDFYVNRVGPEIAGSEIDCWIAAVREHRFGSDERFQEALRTHALVTELFKAISGLEKRSLASKYLHFHLPDDFFLFDTRAVAGMRKFSKIVGRVTTQAKDMDPDYCTFATKCRILQDHLLTERSVKFTTREVDRLLLYCAGSRAK